MFETSVIHAPTRAAGGRLSLLTISILAHSAVIIGAIGYSVAAVDFPASAPDEFAQVPTFIPIILPPPLGDPEGGAAPKPDPVRAATPPTPRPANEQTAPAIVPDRVLQQVAATSSTGDANATGNPNATSTLPFGSPDGVDGPSDIDGIPGTPIVEPVVEKVYLPHEVKAPVGLYRPAPAYPALYMKAKMRATVVVRCIIDKNGRVRDPQVIVPSRPPFNESVLSAVQRWRYTPGSINGQAVDSYFDLTVNFAVN